MRILVVAMLDSIHTARWIGQFEGSNISFTLFPSTANRRIHQRLKESSSTQLKNFVEIRQIDRATALMFGALDRFCGTKIQAWRLRRLLESKTFDAVHLLETQHAGYLFIQSRILSSKIPPVALSVWGSDFLWFATDRRHRLRISEVLQKTDLLFIECDRDKDLAIQMGYVGLFTPLIPASGGVSSAANLELEQKNKPPSERIKIVVKGYTGFVGKAKSALIAIRKNHDLLKQFSIHIYSANAILLIRLWWMRRITKLDIHGYRKKSLSHDEVLQLFHDARVSIAISLSDGLPGSFREAVWTGAFPIESTRSCVKEWVINESDCILVDPEDINAISDAIARVANDDLLVDEARRSNMLLAEKFTNESVREIALRQYKELIGIRGGRKFMSWSHR